MLCFWRHVDIDTASVRFKETVQIVHTHYETAVIKYAKIHFNTVSYCRGRCIINTWCKYFNGRAVLKRQSP